MCALSQRLLINISQLSRYCEIYIIGGSTGISVIKMIQYRHFNGMVKGMQINPLERLIDLNLCSRYSGILSLSNMSLFLANQKGEVLLELISAPIFCAQVCLNNGREVCQEYKDHFALKTEGRFVCRHGLENIILPIVYNNETIGFLGGMQTYTAETEYKKYMMDVPALRSEKQLEVEFIARAIASLKTVDEQNIKIHEQLCHHIVKNIDFDLSERNKMVTGDVARLSIEKEMLEKKIIDLEAKNMSLVINPHFLFNTLNCIARIAHFENSHTTEELIYCLSDLLRYNLKHDERFHTIGAEMENIEKYLYIQKVRFKSRLEYNIKIPEHIKGYKIPNMVIQPIVENALIHGITPKRDGGKIEIFAEKKGDKIIIVVADNGNGFSKEFLMQLEEKRTGKGLGFTSTDKRLKQYFGDHCGLNIVKSDYSGSTVTITIATSPKGGDVHERRLNR